MTDTHYAIASYRERRPGNAALTDLTRRAFAEYPGVITADLPFTEWFVARPGFDPEASAAAWCDGLPVGSVYVTRMVMALSGCWRVVGVVDTVMVAPEHRGHGLARLLMERAVQTSRQAGLDAMQLYTAPGSAGYRLYASLGFEERHRLAYWHRQADRGAAGSSGWHAVAPHELPAVARRIELLRDRRDGVPRLDEDMCRWRWLQRPSQSSATVWCRESEREAEVAASVPVRLTDGRGIVVLKDLCTAGAESLAGLGGQLGAHELVALADERDAELTRALGGADFTVGQSEAAMLLPLGDTDAGDRSRPWFSLAESVIGA